jgi:hypothetical protein
LFKFYNYYTQSGIRLVCTFDCSTAFDRESCGLLWYIFRASFQPVHKLTDSWCSLCKLVGRKELPTCQYIMCFDLMAKTECGNTGKQLFRKESTGHVWYMCASTHRKTPCPAPTYFVTLSLMLNCFFKC